METAMTSPLRVLHLEDNANDAELLQAALESEGIVSDVTRVETRVDFLAALEQGGFDVVLADYTLPSFDGLSALNLARETCPDVPFIFVSGTLGEEVAIEALKIGATDYVLKERLSRLGPSVRRALREAKERDDRKRAEALLSGEKRLLEMIAKGDSLPVILDALCRLVEQLTPGSLSSILLLDPDRRGLWHGAAPSLPKEYMDAIDGIVIGPAAGSCGTAAYRKASVLVSDIAQDPLWTEYRDLALPHGLRACWSTPALASDGRVLGTFAIYSREPRSPTPQQQNIIERITDLASIAIERKRAEEARLRFLESMDQVNRAIQGTNDLEQMTSDVLDAVLSVFKCDRSWVVYPCDPAAASWKVPMEHARPEFPGALALGLELPVDPEIANTFQVVRTSSGPVRFGPASEHPLPAKTAERFSIQSMIALAIYPKGDRPYMLGLHQCSYPRAWTSEEERLFQEIGRRLEDALTSLLMFRNLGDSERKLEEAQRLAHVGYWERDLRTDVITWSDETYRIFGLRPQERILNLADLPELVHPEDRQIVAGAVAEALRGGQRYDVEYRVVRPNGEVRLVHSQGDLMPADPGRPRRMFGTVQDITERKWAEQLERRVEEQGGQLERLGRLKRFFSPQLAELIVAGGAEDPLKSHRQEVTVAFLDLRGFTAFAETAEPEEVMGVLREYHAEMGRLILQHEGTLERFTGDGMMIFFNDPVPVPNPGERAVRMALAMRQRVDDLAIGWRKRGYDLAFGLGIAQGYATIGAIGFEGRWDYGAIGTVTNLAARLCGEAKGGQILVAQRIASAVEDVADLEGVGALTLKGLLRPVPAFNVVGLRGAI